jgi:hypothetical protein
MKIDPDYSTVDLQNSTVYAHFCNNWHKNLYRWVGKINFQILGGVATWGAAPRLPPGSRKQCSKALKNVGTKDWGSWGSQNLLRTIKYGHQHHHVLVLERDPIDATDLVEYSDMLGPIFYCFKQVLRPPETPIRCPHIFKCLGTLFLEPRGRSGGRPPGRHPT